MKWHEKGDGRVDNVGVMKLGKLGNPEKTLKVPTLPYMSCDVGEAAEGLENEL